MAIYKVKVEWRAREVYTIRAPDEESAKQETENLGTYNLMSYDAEIVSELEDVGQEVDSEIE